MAFLKGAKEAGCKIALDDFGSEHSNLKRLMDYDIDIIKLDKSPTCQLIEKSIARAVLRNLALMCDDFRVQIYAEDVECQDISDALLEIGISIHQGFLHGKAIPFADFAFKVDEFQKGLWIIHLVWMSRCGSDWLLSLAALYGKGHVLTIVQRSLWRFPMISQPVPACWNAVMQRGFAR